MASVQKFMKTIGAAKAGLLAALLLAVPAQALADTTAVQTYAQAQIDQGIHLLSDKSLSPQGRRDAIESLLVSMMDLKRIALFVLGPAARTAAPADVDAFVDAFRKFTLMNYEAQLGAYGGQMVKVTGAVEHGPGDFVVNADVIDPADRPGTPAFPVRFRIFDEGGKFAVLDANVEGIWFEVAERDDVQGYLAQNGGSVPNLIAHLNEMTAAIASHP